MKIVVDIPDGMRKALEQGCFDKKYNIYDLCGCVMNGTPLPKGHGRLIDAKELEECIEIMNDIMGESKCAIRMDDVRNMPTIIEADKEGEQK